MKLYVASTFDIVPTVEVIAEILEEDGHTITVKWWSSDGFNMWDKKKDHDSDAFYEDPICREIFHKDLKGIRDADALVLVADLGPTCFTGANVELGMALMLGKPCYSIGKLKNSAMYYPVIRCQSVEELLNALKGAR